MSVTTEPPFIRVIATTNEDGNRTPNLRSVSEIHLGSTGNGIRFSIEDLYSVAFGRSVITSVLSERPLKYADQKTERGKILNPQNSIDRDQPTSRASPLRINTLLSREFLILASSSQKGNSKKEPGHDSSGQDC